MQKLIAYMNGELVGTLEKHKNGAHSFQYDKNWVVNAMTRPLSLSLKLQLPPITSDAVINYFDNLLPDSPQVRDRIVARYQTSSKQPFDLLKEVGKDSVGAITLLPPEYPFKKEPLNYEVLDDKKLESVLCAYQSDIPLGMLEEEDDFRISVAVSKKKQHSYWLMGSGVYRKGTRPPHTLSNYPSAKYNKRIRHLILKIV